MSTAVQEIMQREIDRLLATNAALTLALGKSADRIDSLCGTVNTLAHKLGLGRKVRAEDWSDVARLAIGTAKGTP